jgi:hypothetical protein
MRLGFRLFTHIGLELLFGIHHLTEAQVYLFFEVIVMTIGITHSGIGTFGAAEIRDPIMKMSTSSTLRGVGVFFHISIEG